MVTAPRFVVQLHDATTLHFDFRLQSGEVLRSWAVPKGPSLDPGIRRLAVPVEDHAMSAGEFEGVHDGQRRGSGAVIIWDEGTAEIVRDEPGHISFILYGRKLSGGFALTRTGERRWILVKVRDCGARPDRTSWPSSRRVSGAARPGRNCGAGRGPARSPASPDRRGRINQCLRCSRMTQVRGNSAGKSGRKGLPSYGRRRSSSQASSAQAAIPDRTATREERTWPVKLPAISTWTSLGSGARKDGRKSRAGRCPVQRDPQNQWSPRRRGPAETRDTRATGDLSYLTAVIGDMFSTIDKIVT